MPVLDALPGPEILLALKGKIDYYVFRGIPCARSWPRSPRLPRSSAVQAAAAIFAAFSQSAMATDPAVKEQAIESMDGQPWSWKDVVTSAAYGNLATW